MVKLLLPFAIMALVALSAAKKKQGCGENAEHVECSNQCVATCEIPNPQFCLIAPSSCKAGCKCKEGYVQPSKYLSTCIAKDKCPNAPRSCGENQELDNCINNPRPCPSASGRPVVGHINPVYCKKGCRCKDGYVFSRKAHKCVPGNRCAKSKKNDEAETE